MRKGKPIDLESDYLRKMRSFSATLGEMRTRRQPEARLSVLEWVASRCSPGAKAKEDRKQQRLRTGDLAWRELSGGTILLR